MSTILNFGGKSPPSTIPQPRAEYRKKLHHLRLVESGVAENKYRKFVCVLLFWDCGRPTAAIVRDPIQGTLLLIDEGLRAAAYTKTPTLARLRDVNTKEHRGLDGCE